MSKAGKIAIVVVLVASVGVVIALKRSMSSPTHSPAVNNAAGKQSSKALPRLVDVGGKCLPCKMMKPILQELKTEYAGQLRVDLFDALGDPDVATKYGAQTFPTQIFFDASGKELFRHEGPLSKEDILAKWKELGVELKKAK